MTNKPTQKINYFDYFELLEYKLQQDRLAYKKVMKWATTIQKRIEQNQTHLENFKRNTPEKNEHVVTTLQMPTKLIPIYNNYTTQEPIEIYKPEIQIPNKSRPHQIKQIDRKYSISRNSNRTCIQNRLYPFEKEIKKNKHQIYANLS